MSNYIDKIKKDGVDYDIHASNGGTKLYRHVISISKNDNTSIRLMCLSDTANAVSLDNYEITGIAIPVIWSLNDEMLLSISKHFSSATFLYIQSLYYNDDVLTRQSYQVNFDDIKTISDDVTAL